MAGVFEPMEVEHFATEVKDTNLRNSLYKDIAKILKTGKAMTEFVGSHPVSLTMKNVHFLFDRDYLVCEKTDGIRAMLLIYNGAVYLYDRKNKFYSTRYTINIKDIFFFDGELYKAGDSHVFSIFDSLVVKNECLTKELLLRRLSKASSFTSWLDGSPESLILSDKNPSLFPFRIVTKEMIKSHGFWQVLNSIPTLDHKNDGLIFTPVNEKYIIGARSSTLKWKPPELNTVDFLIKETKFNKLFDLFCSVSTSQLFGTTHTSEANKGRDAIKFGTFYCEDADVARDGEIGEFVYDKQKKVLDSADYGVIVGGWKLHKIRTDKNDPNNIKVIIGLLESIRDNISEKDLKGCYEKIYSNYKKRKSSEAGKE